MAPRESRLQQRYVDELLALAATWLETAAKFRSAPDASLYDDYLGTASGYYYAAAHIAGVELPLWPSFPEWSRWYLAACEGQDSSETRERFGLGGRGRTAACNRLTARAVGRRNVTRQRESHGGIRWMKHSILMLVDAALHLHSHEAKVVVVLLELRAAIEAWGETPRIGGNA